MPPPAQAPRPAPSAPASARAPRPCRSACGPRPRAFSTTAGSSDLPCVARLPAGMPFRYLFGQQALRQRREGDGADAKVGQRVLQPVGFHPAVQDVVAGLVDQQGRAQIFQDRHRLARALGCCSWRCRHTARGPTARYDPARPWFLPAACRGRSGGNRRCRRNRGPSASATGRRRRSGTCGCPIRRRGRPTCGSRPWTR